MSTHKKFCRKSMRTTAQKQNNQPGTRGFVAMIPLKLKEVISDWQPEWPEILKALYDEYSVHKLRGTPRGALRAGFPNLL